MMPVNRNVQLARENGQARVRTIQEKTMATTSTDGAQPAIILVEPQLGENIGAAVRAMANFGLNDLRLVAPRDGWPSPRADAMASGANHVLERVKVFSDLPSAVSQLNYIVATSARARDMVKPVVGPRTAIRHLRGQIKAGARCGVLFGREKWGLTNEEVLVADALMRFPVDAGFTSVNLAQSVFLVAYEWMRGRMDAQEESGEGARAPQAGAAPPIAAPRDALVHLFTHLERALDQAGYFYPLEKRAAMRQDLRTMLTRAAFSEPEVRALRGVVAAFERAMPHVEDVKDVEDVKGREQNE